MKISVVGMGHVGSATAFALVTRGVPHELVLVGRTREKSQGDAYDLLHASALVRPIDVIAGELNDTAHSDIILIAASTKETIGDRLASAQSNAALMRDLIPRLAAASPDAVMIVMTNPVDIQTYVTLQASGFPRGRVFGTGTLIDTARFRALLSRETGVNAGDIRAYILGEHGDSQFPALSVATAGGVRIHPGDETIRAFVEEARQGGHLVARTKGHTNYAVAMSATLICEAIAQNTRTVMPVSTLIDGFRGVRDVCLSLPCVIGRSGIERVLEIDLDEEESDRFRESAKILRAVIDGIQSSSAD